ASIPGLISKIFVKQGEEVKEKQLVAVIEAMKMETQVTAAAGGIVQTIAVKEGQNVEAGELLIRLE
ncbi:MAG: biotin/lipoyl-containing protein, partial [Tissierellaceae bacterium]